MFLLLCVTTLDQPFQSNVCQVDTVNLNQMLHSNVSQHEINNSVQYADHPLLSIDHR